MKIVIESIDHDAHRYSTLGDYWRDSDGTIQIRVTEVCDQAAQVLVAVHEVIEWALTEHRGISEPVILKWDTEHLDSDDPGRVPGAPYAAEHAFAENVERLLCAEFGMTWAQYEAILGIDDTPVVF